MMPLLTVSKKPIFFAMEPRKGSWRYPKTIHLHYGRRSNSVSTYPLLKEFCSCHRPDGEVKSGKEPRVYRILRKKPDDFDNFQRISNILLPNVATPFRNIPLRVFLPSPLDAANPSLKIIQSPFPPTIPAATTLTGQSGRPTQPQIQTIGSALNSLLPSLFPSKRIPVLAKPMLHGTVVPMNAPVEEVVRSAGYADGWLGIVVAMVG